MTEGISAARYAERLLRARAALAEAGASALLVGVGFLGSAYLVLVTLALQVALAERLVPMDPPASAAPHGKVSTC